MGQRSQPPHSSPSTHLAAGHRAGDVIWRPLSPTISHEDAATDCRRIRHPGRGVHRPAWTYLASTHPPTHPPTDHHHQKLARTQAIEQTPGPDCLWTPVSLCRRFLGWAAQLVELAGMVPLLHACCR
jgi:hypothetical protein